MSRKKTNWQKQIIFKADADSLFRLNYFKERRSLAYTETLKVALDYLWQVEKAHPDSFSSFVEKCVYVNQKRFLRERKDLLEGLR